MKKRCYLLCVIVCSISFSATAQKLPSADAVIARYVQVIGGAKKWGAIKTSQFQIVLEADTSVRMVIIKNIPSGYYQKLTTPDGSVIDIYNNGKAVNIQGDSVVPIDSAKYTDDLALQTYALPDMVYKQLGYTMVNQGIKVIKGIACYEIKLVSKQGSTKLNYYEIKNGYLKMTDADNVKSYFEDYKPIYGFMIPFTMAMGINATTTVTFKVESWLINKPVDEKLFVTPEATK